MEIPVLENLTIDWATIPAERLNGTTGYVISHTLDLATCRIRRLTFSEQYEADHWCEKGHIIYVLKGTLIIEYKEGTLIHIPEHNSLILGDHISSHKVRTVIKTDVLIID